LFTAVVALVDANHPNFFWLLADAAKDEPNERGLTIRSTADAQGVFVGTPLLLCLMFCVAWVIRRMVRWAPTSVPPRKQAPGGLAVIGILLVFAMPAIRDLVQQSMIIVGWRVADTVLIAPVAAFCLVGFGAVTGWLESPYLLPHAGSEPGKASGPPPPPVGNRGGAEPAAVPDRPRE
jgi:hypothetical protein